MKECCGNCKYRVRDNNGFHRYPFICKNEQGEYDVPVTETETCDVFEED